MDKIHILLTMPNNGIAKSSVWTEPNDRYRIANLFRYSFTIDGKETLYGKGNSLSVLGGADTWMRIHSNMFVHMCVCKSYLICILLNKTADEFAGSFIGSCRISSVNIYKV